jgi:dTMP kinase
MPALERGRWVISDRFADSTRVYQGAIGNVEASLIQGLERITVGDLKPDITFILDVSTEIGLARASARRGDGIADRFERESVEFHEKLRDAFRLLALSEPERCVLIDANAPSAAVAERIWKVVSERLDPATAPVAMGDVAS